MKGPRVVIAGAGACGTVAALAAAAQGASVLLLEKHGEPNGNTALSSGLIPAAGTRFQWEHGVDDSPELMLGDILHKNGGRCERALAEVLCRESRRLIEWLADAIGVEIVLHSDFLYPGQSRLRMHGTPGGYGAELLEQLHRAVRARPEIEVRFGSPVLGLLNEGGAVGGVRTAEGDLAADAVILAVNGFGGNPAIVREYLGFEAAEALYFGSPNNTGDGIRWGRELGGEVAYMDSYQGHASVAMPNGPIVTWGVVVDGAIMVNRTGRRFGRETVGYSEYALDVLAQPNGEAFEIFDQEVYDAAKETRLAEVIAAGKVVRADSLEELAERFELPERALRETVDAVNRAARGEAPDTFWREEFAGGPLESPFYGIHVRGALFHTQGGLRVDDHGRVLRSDGSPIAGLYAGGGTAAGVSGPGPVGYSSGNGLLAATVLGLLAGEAAGR